MGAPQMGPSARAMPGSNGSTPGPYPGSEPEHKPPPPAGDAATARSFSAGREALGLDPCCLSSKYKVVVFDTEALGKGMHKVVELGAYALESGDRFCTLINPSPIQVTAAEDEGGTAEDEGGGCNVSDRLALQDPAPIWQRGKLRMLLQRRSRAEQAPIQS